MIILGVRNFRVFEILEHLPYLKHSDDVFIPLTNVQMPIKVGILTFMSMLS